MKIFKRTAMALSLIAAGILVSCGGGGGGGSDYYYGGWYDVYGGECGSLGPGCNYYSNGLKIIDVEDPYFSSDYYLEYGTWEYVDDYGYYEIYSGWAWISPVGIIYDDWGNALNETDNGGRDIVGEVAEIERKTIESAGKKFAARYELDEAVGIRVASVLNDWATLGKSRARTQNDIADFTKRLYGIDMNEVKIALEEAKSGDLSGLEAAASKGAATWSTTPETFKEIQKAWFGEYVKGFGL